MINIRIAAWFFLFFTLVSCSKEKYEVDSNTTCNLTHTTYAGDLKIIIDNNCTFQGCHASNSGDNNFDFTTYDGVKRGIGSILDRIDRGIDDPLHMPQGSILNDCDKEKIRAWVLKGGPYN